MTEWVFDPDYGGFWTYTVDRAYITLEKRPAYCDRGHYIGKVHGVIDMDWADGFPRYYMDEARAKAELADWLHWRLKA